MGRAEYLFQTSDQKELETWVETINTVVSRYSCAPLPAPCSNTAKFQRPLYPSSRSKQSLSEQLTNHRQHVRDLSQQRTAHHAQTLREVPKRAFGRILGRKVSS